MPMAAPSARARASVPTPVVIPTARPAGPTPAPSPVATAVPAEVAVELFVDPPSEIEIDGAPLGNLQSRQVTLRVGAHQIRQRIAGYREKLHSVEVGEDTKQLRLTLPPFGLLSVLNDFGVPVQGAKVSLDGTALGGLPIRDRKVEAGTHELRVVWPDGGQFLEQVEISAASSVVKVVGPR